MAALSLTTVEFVAAMVGAGVVGAGTFAIFAYHRVSKGALALIEMLNELEKERARLRALNAELRENDRHEPF